MEKQITELVNETISPKTISNLRIEKNRFNESCILFDYGDDKGDLVIKDVVSKDEAVKKIALIILNAIKMWEHTKNTNPEAQHLLDINA